MTLLVSTASSPGAPSTARSLPSGFSSLVSGKRVICTTTTWPSLPLLPSPSALVLSISLREDDGALHARVVELDPGALAAAAEDAGHALRAARLDLDDVPLGAARAARHDVDDDVVAVHRAAEVLGRDVDVVAARGRARDEAEAARVHLEEALAPLAVAAPAAARGRVRAASRASRRARAGPARTLERRDARPAATWNFGMPRSSCRAS